MSWGIQSEDEDDVSWGGLGDARDVQAGYEDWWKQSTTPHDVDPRKVVQLYPPTRDPRDLGHDAQPAPDSSSQPVPTQAPQFTAPAPAAGGDNTILLLALAGVALYFFMGKK